MKLTEIALILTLLCIVAFSSYYGLFGLKKINENSQKYKTQANAEFFISESFKKTCAGNGFKDLNDWQSKCRALWKLDYIAWSNAQDFMEVDKSRNNKDLMYGKWISEVSSGEVYCRRK